MILLSFDKNCSVNKLTIISRGGVDPVISNISCFWLMFNKKFGGNLTFLSLDKLGNVNIALTTLMGIDPVIFTS